jgi:hypothetical protein
MSKNLPPSPKGSKDIVMFMELNHKYPPTSEHRIIFKNCSKAPLGVWGVEDIGVEPMTLCVQGRCSSQLS